MTSIESAILIIGIVQGVFLALTLMFKLSTAHKANTFLLLLLLAFVIALSVQLMSVSGYAAQFEHLFIIASSTVLLFGPLLYFYVASLTSPKSKLTVHGLLHLLPWFAYLLIIIAAVFNNQAEITVVTKGTLSQQPSAYLLLPALKLLHVVGYTLMCLVLLLKHARRVKDNFSNIDNINLEWLRNLLIGFIVFECLVACAFVFDFDALSFVSNADTLLSFILVLLIFMTGFYGLHQPAILNVQLDTEEERYSVVNKNLREDDVDNIARKLGVLRSQQIHLDRFLNLQTLSDAVGVSPHKLSEYLNEHLGVTFYEYVNHARIEDAKSRLLQSGAYVLDIALDVGFNNKATFNKAFKKFESITPTEFRRQKGN